MEKLKNSIGLRKALTVRFSNSSGTDQFRNTRYRPFSKSVVHSIPEIAGSEFPKSVVRLFRNIQLKSLFLE